MAHVDLYNNTSVSVVVNISGKLVEIPYKQSKRLMFGGQFIFVNSSLGEWWYDRTIIPYGGKDGPYFNGTIRVELNEYGRIYALKASRNGVRTQISLILEQIEF